MQKNKIMKLSTILLSAIVASSLCFESFFVVNSTCEAVVRKVVRRKVVTNRTSNQTQIEQNTDNDFFENNSDNIVEEIPAKNTSGNRRINVNDSNNVSRAAGNPVIKPVSRPESNTAEVLLGDVNGDGKVTLTDVSVLKNYLTGQHISKFNERNADMNGDGNVSITDLSLLKNSIVSGNTTTATNTTNTNQNNLQLLQIVYPAEGLYSLQPYSSPGMELSVEGANAGANANVYITDIGSDKQTTPSHQKWYLTRIGNSEWYKITAENSGLALNIHNGIAQNGNNVTLYPYGGTMHQFRFLNAGNGWYCLQGNVPGQFVLTVDNGGSTAGTNVNIHQYNAGVGQCWKLVRRNPATTVAAKEEVAQRYADVYKDAALQSRYSGRWIGKGETYTVVQASGNALLVNYKSSNGEDRQGWVNKNVREEIKQPSSTTEWNALVGQKIANTNMDYYKKPINPFNGPHNCTWYAFGRTLEVLGFKIEFNDTSGRNANQWPKKVTNCIKDTNITSKCLGIDMDNHVIFIEYTDGYNVYYTDDNAKSGNMIVKKRTINQIKNTYDIFLHPVY